MTSFEARAQARVGLLGNPSDLYGGRGLGFTVAELGVHMQLKEVTESAPSLELPNDLLRAAWKVFTQEARHRDVATDRSFELKLSTNVPVRSGLSGSSAIVIAALRAWSLAYELPFTAPRLAELALEVEVRELGIRAGPLDRVVQAHEGLLDMDFAQPFADDAATHLDPALLPPLFLAWDPTPGEDSGDVHGPIFERWQAGDELVHSVVRDLTALAVVGHAALIAGDHETFRRAVNDNFSLRARLFPITRRDRQAIDIGRKHSAATKFCGSGGSYLVVPGTQEAPENLEHLREAYKMEGFQTLVPTVFTHPTA